MLFEPECDGLLAGLVSASGAEFGEYCRHVVVDCAGRYDEPLGDLAVSQAIGHEDENLDFAIAEAHRIGSGRGSGTA